jgi:hypothetical protein
MIKKLKNISTGNFWMFFICSPKSVKFKWCFRIFH